MSDVYHNTSYSPIDDRFGYSRKGIFLCRDNNELLHIIIFSAIMALLFVGAQLLPSKAESNAASVLYVIAFDVVKVSSFLWFPLFLIAGIRVIRTGHQYDFTADERKMLITYPKKDLRVDIIYENVRFVTYEDITSFGKLRGYSVTVTCSDGTYHFDYLFPKHCSTKDKNITPFYIIEERCNYVAKPEYLAGKRIDDAFLR